MHPSPAPPALIVDLDSRVAALVVCANCHGDLRREVAALVCIQCAARWPAQNGVPGFLSEPAVVMPADQQSNPLGAEFSALLGQNDLLALHLGAGFAVLQSLPRELQARVAVGFEMRAHTPPATA